MALYLVLVGSGRILTELFRTTPQVLLGLTAAQIISMAFITIGGIILFNIASKRKAKNSSEPKPENVKAS
jgi:prolipoprotein diacylglyceryltransferase